MIEDIEIGARFAGEKLGHPVEIKVVGAGNASTLASAVAETLPGMKLWDQPDFKPVRWSEIVDQKLEVWPIEYLLPGGAYVH